MGVFGKVNIACIIEYFNLGTFIQTHLSSLKILNIVPGLLGQVQVVNRTNSWTIKSIR